MKKNVSNRRRICDDLITIFLIIGTLLLFFGSLHFYDVVIQQEIEIQTPTTIFLFFWLFTLVFIIGIFIIHIFFAEEKSAKIRWDFIEYFQFDYALTVEAYRTLSEKASKLADATYELKNFHRLGLSATDQYSYVTSSIVKNTREIETLFKTTREKLEANVEVARKDFDYCYNLISDTGSKFFKIKIDSREDYLKNFIPK